MKTFLVVGLGNPGKDYAMSRHNVGFMVVDRLGNRLETGIKKKVLKVSTEKPF
ncbi:MAG: hypothetical protein KatS3mg078_2128 [Deltaproteobacteria bacterium]|jgi:PTH1 family peptidyl-tRNA hydrolase|nr:Peptidyl-tRNA hydrolase [bacterium HR37]GIW48251.1 MAG: hypothetical protein KatS3mg078_2128 [Deltaproteobacteria bacterium]